MKLWLISQFANPNWNVQRNFKSILVICSKNTVGQTSLIDDCQIMFFFGCKSFDFATNFKAHDA